ncbi:MAG TPA: hypothetical protein VFO34_10000, partial [Candidatus Acidoferrales bacterium]|nr:hypothetical protein [Candidatus Acidoferrales bacterium]
GERSYELRIAGTWPPTAITASASFARVRVALKKPVTGWQYDGETATTIIDIPATSVRQRLSVHITFPKRDNTLIDGIGGKIARLHQAMHTLEGTWEQGWAPDLLIGAAQTGHRVTLKPSSAFDEYQKLAREWPDIIKTVDTLDVSRTAIDAALAQIRAVNQ